MIYGQNAIQNYFKNCTEFVYLPLFNYLTSYKDFEIDGSIMFCLKNRTLNLYPAAFENEGKKLQLLNM